MVQKALNKLQCIWLNPNSLAVQIQNETQNIASHSWITGN